MKQEVEAGLQAALQNLGYVRVKKNVFRAPWTSETVAQVVRLYWFHNFGQSERVQVGLEIRHKESQAFAAAMWNGFRYPLTYPFPQLTAQPTDCFFGVSLGKICGWPLFAVFLDEHGIEGSVRLVIECLEQKLRPLVQDIVNEEALYRYLVQNENDALLLPNGATHAAAAIFLGKRLGVPKGEVLAKIEPFRWTITGQIDRARSVDDFLSQVWDQA